MISSIYEQKKYDNLCQMTFNPRYLISKDWLWLPLKSLFDDQWLSDNRNGLRLEETGGARRRLKHSQISQTSSGSSRNCYDGGILFDNWKNKFLLSSTLKLTRRWSSVYEISVRGYTGGYTWGYTRIIKIHNNNKLQILFCWSIHST